MDSTENAVMICRKSNSSSVRRIVHVCGLRADMSDSGITIRVWDTH
jgi:hypothetical protein